MSNSSNTNSEQTHEKRAEKRRSSTAQMRTEFLFLFLFPFDPKIEHNVWINEEETWNML
jgi:hypothetical protein